LQAQLPIISKNLQLSSADTFFKGVDPEVVDEEDFFKLEFLFDFFFVFTHRKHSLTGV